VTLPEGLQPADLVNSEVAEKHGYKLAPPPPPPPVSEVSGWDLTLSTCCCAHLMYLVGVHLGHACRRLLPLMLHQLVEKGAPAWRQGQQMRLQQQQPWV
jgi:hypothetical protein